MSENSLEKGSPSKQGIRKEKHMFIMLYCVCHVRRIVNVRKIANETLPCGEIRRAKYLPSITLRIILHKRRIARKLKVESTVTCDAY